MTCWPCPRSTVSISGAVFLKAHHVNTHGPLGCLEDTVRSDEGRALKTAGVGTSTTVFRMV